MRTLTLTPAPRRAPRPPTRRADPPDQAPTLGAWALSGDAESSGTQSRRAHGGYVLGVAAACVGAVALLVGAVGLTAWALRRDDPSEPSRAMTEMLPPPPPPVTVTAKPPTNTWWSPAPQHNGRSPSRPHHYPRGPATTRRGHDVLALLVGGYRRHNHRPGGGRRHRTPHLPRPNRRREQGRRRIRIPLLQPLCYTVAGTPGCFCRRHRLLPPVRL